MLLIDFVRISSETEIENEIGNNYKASQNINRKTAQLMKQQQQHTDNIMECF